LYVSKQGRQLIPSFLLESPTKKTSSEKQTHFTEYSQLAAVFSKTKWKTSRNEIDVAEYRCKSALLPGIKKLCPTFLRGVIRISFINKRTVPIK
jgi:hypothetical protein